MSDDRNILLCAGGTGGHLFPAQALAQELTRNGWNVHLATDARAHQYVDGFDKDKIHIVKSATFAGKNPFKAVKTVMALTSGYMRSKAMIRKLDPVCVIGFGGYPTVPPIMAASSLKLPILLHEQNAVMGRANRFLHKRAKVIVMGFQGVKKLAAEKFLVLGNPVREAVLDAAKQPYRERDKNDPFNLLIFGGSQGAQYFSKVLPEAVKLLDENARNKLVLVQQSRPEDQDELRSEMEQLGVPSDIAPFFNPMAGRIADADLVIARGGASTVSELSVIGRPAILVPYPFALDHDQAMNAAEMEKSGGCQVIAQKDLTPQRLAEELNQAISDPDRLKQMAAASAQTGKKDAATSLARLVEHVISGKSVNEFQS